MFIYWLYHGELPESDEENSDIQEPLVRLWIFAERYLMPKLQNAAMESLCVNLVSIKPCTGAMRAAFEVTSGTSVLRKVMVRGAIDDFGRCDLEGVEDLALEIGKLAIETKGQNILSTAPAGDGYE